MLSEKERERIMKHDIRLPFKDSLFKILTECEECVGIRTHHILEFILTKSSRIGRILTNNELQYNNFRKEIEVRI